MQAGVEVISGRGREARLELRRVEVLQVLRRERSEANATKSGLWWWLTNTRTGAGSGIGALPSNR
jgi:hypothetical protein